MPALKSQKAFVYHLMESTLLHLNALKSQQNGSVWQQNAPEGLAEWTL